MEKRTELSGIIKLSSTQQMQENIRPGLIVEYLQNNQPVLAWITETQGSRVRALNINQREIKLPAGRILPWTGPGYAREKSREEISHLLNEHSRTRTREQENICTIEIWELAQGDIDQARPDWFAGLITTPPGPDLVAAMGRAMLQDRAHFKFNPPFFEVYPEDVVQERLHQEKIARERERLTSVGREFFRSLWHSDVQAPVPEISDEWAAEQLRQLLITRVVNPDDDAIQDIWANVTKGLPQDPHLAFLLARKWGIYPEHHNFLLDQAGYIWDDSWHKDYESDTESIRSAFAGSQASPEQEGFISIDSSTTRDIDDAFAIQSREGGYFLHIALACPAMNWSIDSDLDRAVSARASSLYLPEGTSNMLPRFMAEEMFTLACGESRPAMVIQLQLDQEGRVLSVEPVFKWISVAANLSYEQAEAMLAAHESEQLKAGYELAAQLRKRRLEAGAVIISQPDCEISLEDQDKGLRVLLEEKPACPKAQLMVSEFMILVNQAAAQWAAQRNLGLFHRTQNITLPDEFNGIWSRPEEVYRVLRSLGATLTEVQPRPHRTLAVDCYAPVTSPLRRYTDLFNQVQLLRAMQGQSPALDQEQMNQRLPGLNARAAQVAQIQRFRPRYWKLVYFRQNCRNLTWTGVVVDNSGPAVVLSLPREQMLVRAGHDLFGGKTRIGQPFSLRLGKIDPLNNEIHVLEAWEQ